MKNTKLGENYTGAEHAPENTREMLKASKNFPADVKGDIHVLEEKRIIAITEADTIGSVPFALSVKGALKTAFGKLSGKSPEIFIDKLGERLAFERSGIRLYEAVTAKAHALKASRSIIQKLDHIRREEAQHLVMLINAMKELGADPTAVTPSADIAGVIGMGVMQVLTDPRTNLSQSLDALHNTELIDNAAWELLISLANQNAQINLAKQFEEALKQEEEHLVAIRELLQEQLSLDIYRPKRKMKANSYYLVPHKEGGWDLKREGASRASRHFSTKKEAISMGKEMSKKAGVDFITEKNKTEKKLH